MANPTDNKGGSKDLEGLAPVPPSVPASSGAGSPSLSKPPVPPAPGAGKPPGAPPSPPKLGEGESYSGGLRVSLIPSGEEETPASNLRRRAAIVLAIVLVEAIAIGGGYFVMSGKEASRRQQVESMVAQINEASNKIREVQPQLEEVAKFDARVNAIDQLLNNQRKWTPLLGLIEDNSKAEVSFGNFTGDYYTGSVFLDAEADSYRTAAEQIVALRQHPLVESVDVWSASTSMDQTGKTSGVTFSLSIKFKPDAWKTAATDSLVNGTPGSAEGTAMPSGAATTPE